MMHRIALTGYPGTGKDAAAAELVRSYGFRRLAFADALKQELLDLDPEYKDLADLEWCKRHDVSSTREKLQNLGMVFRRIGGPGYWIDKLMETLDRECEWEHVVVTDVRMPNEAYALRALGFELVAVDREGFGPVNQHASEEGTEACKALASRTVENTGTVEELAAQVLNM